MKVRKTHGGLLQLNNNGMTLIELLVVMALMVILTGGAMVGVGILNSADAKKASNVIYSKMNELREDTLSIDSSWKMIIRQSDGSNYVEIYRNNQLQETEKLGSRIKIKYKSGELNDADWSDESGQIEDDKAIEVTYQRGSGRFNTIIYGTFQQAESEVNVTDIDVSDNDNLQHQILVTGGNSSYVITLWKNTGRITVNQK